MKIGDIKTFTKIEGCYSESAKIDGVDLKDIPFEEKLELLNSLIVENSSLLDTIIEDIILDIAYQEDAPMEIIKQEWDTCSQCGNVNETLEIKIYKKDKNEKK